MACSRLFSLITTIFIIFVVVPNIWLFQKLASIKDVAFRVFITAAVSVIFIPIMIYCLFWLVIYRFVVSWMIWMYHGRKFNRMLDGWNRIYTVQDTSPHVILFLTKYNQPFDFYPRISHIIGNALKEKFQNDEVFSTISSFLGYNYLIKNEACFTEYVKPLPLTSHNKLDNDSLLNAIEEHAQGPLPDNNNGLWEVLIGTKEVEWATYGEDVECFYPIVLRFHPCIPNILNIMNTIFNVPCVEEDKKYKSCGARLDTITKCSRLQKLSSFIRKAGYFFMSPSVFLENALAMRNEDCDSNILYGPELSNRKTFCVFVEPDPDQIDYLTMRIKKKFPGTSSQDLLITAFTGSLQEYYDKLLGEDPTSKPAFILSENYVSTRSIENVKEDCINTRYSAIMLKLPIGSRFKRDDTRLVSMLQDISEERKLLKNGIENTVHYEMLKIFFTYLPSPLLKMFINKYKFTTIINNLPCPIEEQTIDGQTITSAYVWTPHRGNTGISLTRAKYDGRVQLALSVDKTLIPNRVDVQSIVDGIYKNLVIMDNIQIEQIATD